MGADLSLLNSAWAQLGGIGLLLLFMWWSLRTKNKECRDEREQHNEAIEKERARNQVYSERVILIAETSARTAAELTAAVKDQHA